MSKTMRRCTPAAVLIGCCAVLVLVASGYAATPSSDDDSGSLAEVVVTAQKRAERSLDVPISVTSLSELDLRNAGVDSNMDLTSVVPGLEMDRIGGFVQPSIRGISTQVTELGADPNVATYIDGVYQSNPYALTFDLPDVSRIEVAKGPQGTLFGRNATGGAVQIFTRDPSFSPTGDFYVGYGSFRELTFKSFLSGPIIGDELAASISGYASTADSYYRSLVPEQTPEGPRSTLVRGKVLFRPTDSMSFVLQAYYADHDDPTGMNGSAYGGITLANVFPGSIIPIAPYDVATSRTVKQDVISDGVSGRGTLDTAVGTVSILAALNHSLNRSVTSADFAFIPPFPGGGNYYDIGSPDTAYMAEVNLASKSYGPFSFIAGVNYYHDKDTYDPLNVTGILGPVNSYAIGIFSRQTSRDYAAFTELTMNITDRLTAIAGARYSSELRTVSGLSVVGTYPQNPGPFYPFGEKTFVSTTPRATLRYKIATDTNVYFTFSEGFKSGAFDATSVPYSPDGTPPGYVRPERVNAYEVGVKTKPTAWLRLDAALYDYNFADQQAQAFVLKNGIPLGSIENAASSKIRGAELDADVLLSRDLRIHTGLSYLHARYTDFPNAIVSVPSPENAGTTQTSEDVSGNTLPRAPNFTVSFSADYTRLLAVGTLGLNANVYYTGKSYFDPGNLYYQGAYAKLGFQATWVPVLAPNLKLAAWGRNLTNKATIMGTFIEGDAAGAAWAPPRTWGVSADYTF